MKDSGQTVSQCKKKIKTEQLEILSNDLALFDYFQLFSLGK